MRLAFLSDAIYPFHHGGKETLQYERSVRLARRGHAVRVHTMHWWPEIEREILREGVALNAISPAVPLYKSGGTRSVWQALVVGLGALRLLWSAPFDVLDVDQFPFTPFFAARLVCRLRRRPMTATWYEVWNRDYWKEYMGWLGPFGFWLQRVVARWPDLVFADSALTARRLTDWLGVEPARVRVLSPGISIDPYEAQPSGKQIDCIVIGRLLPHKHVDVVLRALARLPTVTAVVVGSGPEKDRLMALAGQLNLTDRVTFESPDTKDAVRSRLRSARLFVSASTREGFGVAVLEAAACSIPALVVRHPDNAALELIRHGENGIICALDAEAMAVEIRSFLADNQSQLRMSRNARQGAAAYGWDAYIIRMEAELQTLIAPSPPVAGLAA
jgi:glycosyltransferase involved in cell wall biosynthesis